MEDVGDEMLLIKLLVYQVMSMAYMVSAVVACNIIIQRPESNRPWLIAGPSLILMVVLFVIMIRDLLS